MKRPKIRAHAQSQEASLEKKLKAVTPYLPSTAEKFERDRSPQASKMSAIETTVDTVLEQFATLDFKEQQKFAAAMTRHLQGSAPAKKGAKKAAKKDDSEGEEKVKKELSPAMAAWHALVKIVRDTIKERVNPEKNVQTPVFAVAGRFKEEGNNEPSADEIIELYTAYIDAPWESATAKKRAASKSDGESVGSCLSAEKKPKAKAAAPKKEAKVVEKPKAAPKKVVVEEDEDEEIEEREPIVVEAKKKDSYPAGSTDDDTPPMAFDRKMVGGKKVKMAKKPWPSHCWAQDGNAYLGVWDESRKAFDTDYDDPLAE